MRILCLPLLGLLMVSGLFAQDHSHSFGSKLEYPDVPGFRTLKVDLHQHTVFSDGSVWPSIRVMEALRDGLDAISLTEHLEYQPHQEDIPHPDRNRSYQIAMAEARDHELLIVHGVEITRSAPMGHSNAIFIEDANTILAKDSLSPFQEARRQNAFVFWNHPAWPAQSPKGNPILSSFQKDRIENGELHGIEVINSGHYAEESLELALEYNLTIMGTSDIHGLIDWDYGDHERSRPITLVFAREKSLESLREALFAGRTVAVYNNLWVGRKEHLVPLLQSTVELTQPHYLRNTDILEVTLKNHSSSDLMLENAMEYSFGEKPRVFVLKAKGETRLMIKTLERKDEIMFRLTALNAYTGPGERAIFESKVAIQKPDHE